MQKSLARLVQKERPQPGHFVFLRPADFFAVVGLVSGGRWAYGSGLHVQDDRLVGSSGWAGGGVLGERCGSFAMVDQPNFPIAGASMTII
jgi:hypothetical protein